MKIILDKVKHGFSVVYTVTFTYQEDDKVIYNSKTFKNKKEAKKFIDSLNKERK